MILCDIGNSNVDFYHDGKIWSESIEEFEKYEPKERVYYISVNEKIDSFLQDNEKYVDVSDYFTFDTIYQGMGVDRIAACSIVSDGIVVDAGTAITVDIMSNNIHLGGYILPGISAYEQCYAKMSPALNKRINPNVALDGLPQKTSDAISYGAVKSILMMLRDTCRDKPIYFTGGDGKYLSKFFDNAIFDRSIVFRGMIKAIESQSKEQDRC